MRPAAVFRRFHHIDQVFESGVSGQTVVELLPANLANGRDFDVAFLETILPANLYMRLLPNADAASNFAALDAGAEFFGEKHVAASLRAIQGIAKVF